MSPRLREDQRSEETLADTFGSILKNGTQYQEIVR